MSRHNRERREERQRLKMQNPPVEDLGLGNLAYTFKEGKRPPINRNVRFLDENGPLPYGARELPTMRLERIPLLIGTAATGFVGANNLVASPRYMMALDGQMIDTFSIWDNLGKGVIVKPIRVKEGSGYLPRDRPFPLLNTFEASRWNAYAIF